MAQISISKASQDQKSQSVSQADRLPIWKAVFLHLFPGLLALAVFTLIARPVESMGYPSIMPWLISVSLTVIPFETGYLYYEGRRRNGRFSLDGVILYRQPLKVGQIVLWTILTFLAVLILFALSGPLTNYLQRVVFAWVPDWFLMDTGLEGGGFSKSALLVVNIASIFVFLIGIPIVEEIYFRGYLLPRLAHFGLWAVVINAFLFALYHFTTPWGLVFRFLNALALAYTTYRKQNLLPAIIVHFIANSVDVVMGFAYVLNM
jgi:membrane protease YdiL (CAAX protease family)